MSLNLSSCVGLRREEIRESFYLPPEAEAGRLGIAVTYDECLIK